MDRRAPPKSSRPPRRQSSARVKALREKTALPKGLEALQSSLGYVFREPPLLIEALTHGSARYHASRNAVERNFERLEFLGDRVLGILCAEALVRRFPDANEGELAPRLNALVRRETCAAVAEEAGLGPHILLAQSEIQSGGRRKPAILADACEAVMGALYLDGGLEAARPFFETHWLERLETLGDVPRDAKTELQEWAQARGLGVPAYQVTDRSGPDHAPVFVVEVAVKGLDPERAQGNSKRAAEQEAAKLLLAREAGASMPAPTSSGS